ncbi:MAG: hypothetical protein U0324_40960 [Polyangiales bacterium]
MRTPPPFPLLALLALAGCREVSVGIRVVTPDGGDPFAPPDAATQARFRLERDPIAPVTAPVAANGSFTLEADVGTNVAIARGFVDALRDGVVVGGGATPPIQWATLGPAFVSVFVQRRDSVVEYPWALRYARTAPAVFEVSPSFVMVASGTSGALPVESHNQLTLEGASDGPSWDPTFDRDASFVSLANGTVLAVRGCAALQWDPTRNTAPTMPTAMPPMERCDVTQSTVVQEPGGGAILLGGRRGPELVARVDLVMPDGTWMSALPLAAPRARPAAIRTGPFEALVGGGQAMGQPFLERYSRTLEAARRPIRTGNAGVDERTAAALVEVKGLAYALGGTVLGSTDLTANDAVLDLRCADGSCPLLVATPTLLRERRRDPVAAVAEGDRVVVASGVAPGGVAASVEVIDASSPRAPVAVGPVASLPYDGLTATRLQSGAVLFAGGGTTRVWLYRH